MNDAYPIHEAYRLSDAERQRIFATNILRRFERIKPVTHPTVHFFGAQPGAGKTQAEAVVAAQLHERDGPNSVMAIIGDDLRAYHPQYEQLMVDDDQRAAQFTASDSAWWVEQAIEHARQLRPHVLIEGTLRRAAVTEASARPFVEAGFTAELHVMAVHEFISRLRIFERYVQQIQTSGHGRYTTRADHDASYDVLPGSVEHLMDTGLFGRVSLVGMDGQPLASAPAGDDAAKESLLEVLHHTRQTPPDREVILERLDQFAEIAAGLGKEEMRREVEELRVEVVTTRRA